MMPELVTPTCPLCSQPPVIVLDVGRQAFCGSDDCPVLTWDMSTPLDELLTTYQSVSLDEAVPDGQ
jgi:hypothetical protein